LATRRLLPVEVALFSLEKDALSPDLQWLQEVDLIMIKKVPALIISANSEISR
jgi:hypothetical protein